MPANPHPVKAGSKPPDDSVSSNPEKLPGRSFDPEPTPSLPERQRVTLGGDPLDRRELERAGLAIPEAVLQRMRRFVFGMRITNTVKLACHFTNITRRQYNRWLLHYPPFAEALVEAREDFRDNVKQRLLEAAEKGDHIALRLILRGEAPDLYGQPWTRKQDKVTKEQLADALWAAAEREPPSVR